MSNKDQVYTEAALESAEELIDNLQELMRSENIALSILAEGLLREASAIKQTLKRL